MNRYDQDLQDLIGFVKQYGTLRENEVTMFMRSINHNMKAGFPRSSVFENPEWEKLLAGVIDYMKVNSELFENLIDKIKTQPFTHDLALSNMVFYVRPLTIEERTHFWLNANSIGEMTLDEVRALDHYDEQWQGVPKGALSMMWTQSYSHLLDLNPKVQFNAFILSILAIETQMMPDWVMGNVGTVSLINDDEIQDLLEKKSLRLPTFYINEEFSLDAEFDLSMFRMVEAQNVTASTEEL
jgi:hypothetical protein